MKGCKNMQRRKIQLLRKYGVYSCHGMDWLAESACGVHVDDEPIFALVNSG